MESFFRCILQLADRHGLCGTFWLMVVESLGFPAPTEAGFLATVRLVQAGRLSYCHALAAIVAGQMLGSLASYSAARWCTHRLERRLSQSRRWSKAHTRLQTWYSRFGSLAIFLGRVVGYVRPYSSLVAGFAGVPLVPFVVWTLLGTLTISVASLACVGGLAHLWAACPQYRVLLATAVAVVCLGSVWWSLWQAARQRRRSEDATRTTPSQSEQ